jgi:putative glycerol-1-phosphate prenyltransferase
MSLYQYIQNSGNKLYALLVDPDKYSPGHLKLVIEDADRAGVDLFFLGGSLITKNQLEEFATVIKDNTDKPLILFPGSVLQITDKADAILMLSLISGRNPELLIGQHVIAAPYLKESNLEIIPTGYMLIENGSVTTAQYISNTAPIPREKDDIAACTAMAGEMLGLKLIYLDAGSGAAHPVTETMIHSVKEKIAVPLIVGGGIKTAEQALKACRAGADLIVTGNAIEKDPKLINYISDAIHSS